MDILEKIRKDRNSDLFELNQKELKLFFKSKNNLKELLKQVPEEDQPRLDKLFSNKKLLNSYIDSIENNKKYGHQLDDKPFSSYNRGMQYETTKPFERFQADLADMNFLKKYKIPLRKYSWVLVVVDLFSTKVWYIAVTKKNKNVMSRVLYKFFVDLRNTYRKDKHIWLHVDKGGEFYNSLVKQNMKDLNISLYSTKGKAFMAEERIFLLKKYFKDKIRKNGNNFLKNGRGRLLNWWMELPRIQNKVNKLQNSRLRESPNDLWNESERDEVLLFKKNERVTKALKSEYQRNIKEKTQIESNKPGINLNAEVDNDVVIDNVERNDDNRKNKFTKDSTNVQGNWSKTEYTINNILRNNTNIGPPSLYQLKDKNGKILKGLFTREEFHNSNNDRLYKKIEKENQIEEYGEIIN